MGFLLPRSARGVGIASAVVTVLVWTAFIVIGRASAGRTLLPFDIGVCRIVGASAVLLPWGAWLVWRERRAGATGGSWLGLSPLSFRVTASVGVFGGLGYAALTYTGFFYAPAAHASVLMPGSLPLWTALMAMWWLDDRITPARALGLALIVLGGLLVGGASLARALDGGEVWKGDLLFMSAALCWAAYSVQARRHGLDAVKGTIAITVFAFFTYLPAYAVLALSGSLPSRLATAPWGEIVFQAVFQGVGTVVVSGIAFTQMIRYFGPIRSTMITALVPGLSALGAVVWLGEPLSWNLWVGLGCVTAGIVFGVQAVSPTADGPISHVAGGAAAVDRPASAPENIAKTPVSTRAGG